MEWAKQLLPSPKPFKQTCRKFCSLSPAFIYKFCLVLSTRINQKRLYNSKTDKSPAPVINRRKRPVREDLTELQLREISKKSYCKT